MAHTVISGPTMCGKSTFARYLIGEYRARGVLSLVCDPLLYQWPGAAWTTTSRAAFLDYAKRARSCALFVDEAGMTIARDKEAEWLFTVARHWGHRTHVMSQSAMQMTPLMRGQCARLVLFTSSPRETEVWAEEFNDRELLRATELPQFYFMIKERFRPVIVSTLSGGHSIAHPAPIAALQAAPAAAPMALSARPRK